MSLSGRFNGPASGSDLVHPPPVHRSPLFGVPRSPVGHLECNTLSLCTLVTIEITPTPADRCVHNGSANNCGTENMERFFLFFYQMRSFLNGAPLASRPPSEPSSPVALLQSPARQSPFFRAQLAGRPSSEQARLSPSLGASSPVALLSTDLFFLLLLLHIHSDTAPLVLFNASVHLRAHTHTHTHTRCTVVCVHTIHAPAFAQT